VTQPSPPRSGAAFLVRSGHFFFRYRDGILPGVLLTLLALTRPQRPLDSDVLDGVMDGLGLLLICAGQMLRIGTIGYAYIVRGGRGRRVYAEGLVTSGLFATSRNPLYVGNLLIYTGLLVVWNNPWVYVLGGPFFVFLYRSIVAAEEEFLHGKFGPAFERYCHDVARWVPDPRQLQRAVAGMSFNWRRVVLKEYGTVAAWTLTVVALLIVEELEFASYADRSVEILRMLAVMVAIISLWGLTRWLKLSRRLRA
jgi:protein-S-isoprenylcysteine O-methyltransferase Ste14